MKIHIGRKHKDISQLDGEIQTERDKDDWWENNLSVSLKTLKVYNNVIEDIKESKLPIRKFAFFDIFNDIVVNLKGRMDF